jgi:hypothetical protein
LRRLGTSQLRSGRQLAGRVAAFSIETGQAGSLSYEFAGLTRDRGGFIFGLDSLCPGGGGRMGAYGKQNDNREWRIEDGRGRGADGARGATTPYLNYVKNYFRKVGLIPPGGIRVSGSCDLMARYEEQI